MNRILLIVFILVLNGCMSPKKIQINSFKETLDKRIGRELNPEYLLNHKDYKEDKISEKIIRYYFKMNRQGYMGGKDCVIYEDVDVSTNKILAWGYVNSPDKCRKGLNWLVF
jgi:hypothetical protein